MPSCLSSGCNQISDLFFQIRSIRVILLRLAGLAITRMFEEHLCMSMISVQIISMLVAEIILCIKEVNHKTRVAAYELLVSLAKTMHESDPPSAGPEEDVCHG